MSSLELVHLTGASPEADLADWHALRVATHAVDALDEAPPWRKSDEGGLDNPWPGGWARHYLVRRDGAPVAHLRLSGSTQANTTVGNFEGAVHPAHRRRGIGTELLAEVERIFRAEGMKKTMTWANTSLDHGTARDESGARFLAALGFREVGEETRRAIDLPSLDADAVAARHADALAKAGSDYEVVRFTEPAPEEFLPDLAVMNGRLSQDVAGYIEDWEPTPYDTGKLIAYQDASAARGWRRPHVAVRHKPSGHLVAWSFVAINSEDGAQAEQAVTVVLPEHRGHRLGALVKYELYRYATEIEPNLRRIDTWNAAENEHMIAINEQMGFFPVESFHEYQREL
ncbi:hypothetical protein Afil01_18550 [Actinorhabdospora filicis]|uniref:N-acetyltransferase domain-containing protein n=1 Tax=Actinorhabdospora filicis TaxID=1785913 RepID=A0A9W6W8J7_9ACTN|nr:GNAT family N-acetyltransferase [Actinorhabdospora filicis]GLZ77048.1 hypothetical protein Afil01_18550 [Actinorhabdospora filicis]